VFKRLLEEYIKNRLNKLDMEIEEITELHLQNIEGFETKSVIKQVTYQIDNEILNRIKKLQIKVMIYQSILGNIYNEKGGKNDGANRT
jgi:hypothetical protein